MMPSDKKLQIDKGLTVAISDTPEKISMWRDPLVRILGLVIAAIIIAALGTVIATFLSGSLSFTRAPQTTVARDVIAKKEAFERDKTEAAWQGYAIALINDRQYEEAQRQIEKAGKADYDLSRNQPILYVRALLAYSQGGSKKAEQLFQEVVDKTSAAYEEQLKEGGTDKNWAIAEGISANYATSLLGLSNIYSENKQWDLVKEVLDKYLEVEPTDFGVQANRGMALLELGDSKGAKKDFTTVLKVLPEDPIALEGMRRIEGAAAK